MSIRALNWAFEQEVFSTTDKFVLVALANYANESGHSYPSLATLCHMTGIKKEETVREALRQLTAGGFLIDTGDKYGETSRIRIFQFPPEACRVVIKSPLSGGITKKSNTPPNTPGNTPPNPPFDGTPHIDEPGTRNHNKMREVQFDIPTNLRTEAFRSIWSLWLDDRRARRKLVTSVAAKMQLRKLEKIGVERAVAAIENSIANGYQGIYEPNRQHENYPGNSKLTPSQVRNSTIIGAEHGAANAVAVVERRAKQFAAQMAAERAVAEKVVGHGDTPS